MQAANVACRQIGYQNGAIHTLVGQNNNHPNLRQINLEMWVSLYHSDFCGILQYGFVSIKK